MYRLEQTDQFLEWMDSLRDAKAQSIISRRLVRVSSGLLGDIRTVGDGISEIRIDYGPGYRLYFTMRQQVLIVLLCGSDKGDQRRAIKLAKDLAQSV